MGAPLSGIQSRTLYDNLSKIMQAKRDSSYTTAGFNTANTEQTAGRGVQGNYNTKMSSNAKTLSL
jgi:hypothetical protein